jgi:drug/metabolite transporter (DMT)-like permease
MRFVRVHLLLLLSALFVSGSFPVGAAISGELDPVVLTLFRFGLATLLFAPLVQRYYGLRVSLAALARYSLVSISLVVFFWSMFVSLRYTTALNTSAIFTLVPGLSGIYAVFLNRERLGKVRIGALLLGVVGALWIIFRGDFSLFLAFQWNRGDLIFFAGCLFIGLYPPLVQLLHRGEPMLQMSFWIMATGTFWLLLLAGPQALTVSWADVPLKVWGGITYLAIGATIFSFFVTQYAILFLGPTRVASYSYLYPALVLVLEIVFYGTWPGWKILPGVALVFGAMLIIQGMDSKP